MTDDNIETVDLKPRMCPNGGPCTSDRCEPADQCLGGTKEQYDNLARGAA